jgi:hypothetical protein
MRCRKQAQKSSQVVQKSLMKKNKKKKMCRGRELKDVKRERA